MDVQVLKTDDPACEAFVKQTPMGKSCHTQAWTRAVAEALGHRSLYLVAREDEQVCGILPLVLVRSRLFGNRLVSQALSDYGGVLAESPNAVDALYQRAVELATEQRCESIEFRNIDPLPHDLHIRTDKMCMHMLLTTDPEDLWKAFNPKVRNQVRKAEKSDLVVINGRHELLDIFYRIYTIRMRQLGSPCYSRRVMLALLDAFPNSSSIFAVRLGELTVGAGLTICFNGFVEMPFAATLIEYNKLCPNNLLYWEVIKHYCLSGARCFDFGRCTVDGPTHRFKKQWGSQPVQLYYQYWARPGHTLTIASPDNPKYKRKVDMWKKLPLWVTRLIGPAISRSLP